MPTEYRTDARLHVHTHPIACERVRLKSFLAHGERGALQRLVDRNLNAGRSGDRYTLLAPIVAFTFARLPHIHHPGSALGAVEEDEAAVWVPVRRGAQVRWMVAYMFVNDGFSLSAGREIFGFPKELGSVEGLDEPHAARLRAMTSVVPRFAPDARAETRCVFEARRAGDGAARLGPGLEPILAAVRPLLRGGALPIVQARQLPAIEDGARAAYADLVEFEARLDAPPRVRPLEGRYALDVEDFDTHPLRRDLGLNEGPVPALAAFEVEMDFTLGVGRTRAREAAAGRKERVAILGGGISGLSAAWALTSQPGWQDRYEIDVYQMGWRLGGKAASGRNMACAARSEEHGLHIWFGFYRNAFGLMQEVCDDLGRSLDELFVAQPLVALAERGLDGWIRWVLNFTPDRGRPARGEALPPPRVLLQRLVALVGGYLRDAPFLVAAPATQPLDAPEAERAFARLRKVARRLARLLRGRACALGEAERRLEQGGPLGAVSAPLARFRRWLRAWTAPHLDDSSVRLWWLLAESALTAAIGMIEDRVVEDGFDAIDGEDFRAWLLRHGCHSEAADTPMVRALYDATFAYEGGDTSRPNLAAGAALQTSLRMLFTYEGSVIYKMTAGMGEAVVAPLYQALARRGVRFHFFHRVDALELDASGRRVARVQGGLQARVHGGGYQPLIRVGQLACWPSEPVWEQLERGEMLRSAGADFESTASAKLDVEGFSLVQGEDYDKLVLAIPVGGLPRIAAPLAQASPRFKAMLEHARTVATQASQLWFSADAPPLPEAIHGALPGPLSSWLDSAPVLETERWPDPAPARLLYGCGPAPDHGPVDVAGATERLLEAHGALLFSRGYDPAWLVARYHRLNRSPEERYVQARAGTLQYRLRGDASGFEDLLLAGDWTWTGFHIASIESSVMSGLIAARGIDGVARRIVGETRPRTQPDLTRARAEAELKVAR